AGLGGLDVTPAVDLVVANTPTCQFTNTSDANLNMRVGPGTNYKALDVLDQGDSVTVYGQSEDGDWVRSSRGWVYAPFGSLACGASHLTPMRNVKDAYLAPMQAFTFAVDDDALCETAPAGLLIQTPEGQTANIMVNNVELHIGSTTFVTMTNANEEMITASYTGNVSLTANNTTWNLPNGGQAGVPMNNGQPTGGPQNLGPLNGPANNLNRMITGGLPSPVNIPPPSTVPQTTGGDGSDGGDGGSTLPTGQWGFCGSCDTCGHESRQCVTSPEGLCLWDPTFCLGLSDSRLSVSQGAYMCSVEEPLSVAVTYNPSDGSVISDASAVSDFFGVTVDGIMPTSATSFDVDLFCG
ncbi:MAG: SH3 domain-containing protein, partial [bacterium]|nr:SH3 domain-containing protein [bacterium]